MNLPYFSKYWKVWLALNGWKFSGLLKKSFYLFVKIGPQSSSWIILKILNKNWKPLCKKKQVTLWSKCRLIQNFGNLFLWTFVCQLPVNLYTGSINIVGQNLQMQNLRMIFAANILIRTVHTVVKTIANLGIRNTLVSIAGKFVIRTSPIMFESFFTTTWKNQKNQEIFLLKTLIEKKITYRFRQSHQDNPHDDRIFAHNWHIHQIVHTWNFLKFIIRK